MAKNNNRNTEITNYLIERLVTDNIEAGDSTRLSLPHPYYKSSFIVEVIRSLPAFRLRLLIGDQLNPLERLGWSILDEHAKNYAGATLNELVDQYNDSIVWPLAWYEENKEYVQEYRGQWIFIDKNELVVIAHHPDLKKGRETCKLNGHTNFLEFLVPKEKSSV